MQITTSVVVVIMQLQVLPHHMSYSNNKSEYENAGNSS